MTLLVLYIQLIISGLFLAIRYNRKIEESIVISLCFICLFSYIFGFLGILNYSTYALLIIIFILLIYIACYFVKNKNYREKLKLVFNINLIYITIIYLLLIFFNYGKLFSCWDEFSHWGDCVKAMTIYDDLNVNPILNGFFQDYPPAMSLLQYYVEKLSFILSDKNIFVEWYLYFAYQLFYFSFSFPIIFKTKHKLIVMLTLFIFPYVTINNTLYFSCYIDGLIPFIFGSWLSYNIYYEHDDAFYHLMTCLICAILVLTKEIGIYFSIFTLIIYVLISKKFSSKQLLKYISVFLSIAISKLSWIFLIHKYNSTQTFTNPINIRDVVNVIFFKDNTYKQEVYNKYFYVLANTSQVNIPKFKITYLLIIALLFMTIIICTIIRKNNKITIISILALLSSIIYVYGLSIIYVFKFADFEAINLNSIERYLAIGLNGLIVYAIFLFFDVLVRLNNKKFEIAMIVLIFLFTSFLISRTKIIKFVNRESIEESFISRKEYTDKEEKLLNIINKDEKIFFISQEDEGFDLYVSHYLLRPAIVFNRDFGWSFGKPYHSKDYFSKDITSDDLLKELIENKYDYVYIFKCNDYFVNHFSNLFAINETIDDNRIYKLNINDMKLYEYK